MKKILIFKNDRVGDLFHSLKGINQILNEHLEYQINIYLSDYSKGFNFLFDRKNIKVKILNYRISFIDRISLLFTIFNPSIEKIYILSPKKFLFFLPFIQRKIKFYGICVNDGKKFRPNKYLRNFLFKKQINDRNYKKKGDSISNLIYKLCKSEEVHGKPLLNLSPNYNKELLSLNKHRYCHFHFKKSIYVKNKWKIEHLQEVFKILNNNKYKILLTSDIEKTEFNDVFKRIYPTHNFENFVKSKISNMIKKDINYLENVQSIDLFHVIRQSSLVIAPHGTMSVAASFLSVPVIDIFDDTINKIAFREYKPDNSNYNFFILKPFSSKFLSKFKKILSNV